MKKPENEITGKSTKERGIPLRDFEVKRVKMWESGDVVADVTLNGVTVYGIRVVEGKNGDFLSLPQRKGSDGKYYHIAYYPFTAEDQTKILCEIERQLNSGN